MPDQEEKTTTGSSNKTVTLVIVIVAIVAVLGIAGYFLSGYLAKKAANQLINSGLNASGIKSGGLTNLGEENNSFATATESNPTDSLTLTANNKMKPLITLYYGEVKLTSWFQMEKTSTLMYLAKEKPTVEAGQKLTAALEADGYTKLVETSENGDYGTVLTKEGAQINISANGEEKTINVIYGLAN